MSQALFFACDPSSSNDGENRCSDVYRKIADREVEKISQPGFLSHWTLKTVRSGLVYRSFMILVIYF
jgi:hypothetical protein